jgi:hypothetical protein
MDEEEEDEEEEEEKEEQQDILGNEGSILLGSSDFGKKRISENYSGEGLAYKKLKDRKKFDHEV